MNYLWACMILIGIIYGAFHGTLPDITVAAMDSAKEAITLCITMMGVMSFWVGIMKIAEKTGVIESAAKKMAPCLAFLFPGIPRNHPANRYIATNMIANIFGLGWAATPAGLKAMEELENLEEERRKQGDPPGGSFSVLESKSVRNTGQKRKLRRAVPRGVASNEMCTFLIINISSLQLIPVNIIAYRSQYGSVNPSVIIGPALLATCVSTGIAVVFCKWMDRKQRA